LEEKDSFGNKKRRKQKMKKTIYIQLLNEGSIAYRPVSACAIKKNIYKVDGSECYNPEDEEWEFLPGTYVLVEEQNLSGEKVLVAIKNID
jgi:hypothetical protein